MSVSRAKEKSYNRTADQRQISQIHCSKKYDPRKPESLCKHQPTSPCDLVGFQHSDVGAAEEQTKANIGGRNRKPYDQHRLSTM